MKAQLGAERKTKGVVGKSDVTSDVFTSVSVLT